MSRFIAFFGATGGCANACLAQTLLAGYYATALVRSREKLLAQLHERGVADEVVSAQLTMVQGDVRDQEAVGKALRWERRMLDVVISGLGGTPTPQLSLLKPLITTDPTVIEHGTQTILTALETLATSQQHQQPLLVIISANGVRDVGARDYPLALTVLYRWMLRGMFDDKRAAEALLLKQPPAGGWVIVRPSMLVDGPARGLEMVRQGTDEEPVLGWSIAREDVGEWLFERIVKAGEEGRRWLVGKGVGITY